MGKPAKVDSVTLNHIKVALGNSELKKKVKVSLIQALLPTYVVDIVSKFGESAVETFCGGNRKGSEENLSNVTMLDDIVNIIKSSDTFVNDTLNLIRKWILSEPMVTKRNPVFNLVLISKPTPSNTQKKQFTQLKDTLNLLISTETTENITYALFLLILVAIFQERIFKEPCLYQLINRGIKHTPVQVQGKQQEDAYYFLTNALAESFEETIESVDMAFHGGDQWLYHGHDNKSYLLNQMINKGISLRVIVNTRASVDAICSHMRQEGAEYVGFEKAISQWRKKAMESDGLLKIGVLDFPLLHRIYLVRKKDGTGSAHVTFYTYFKDFVPENEIIMCFQEGSKEFSIIVNEFDYLWECAKK